MTVKNKVRWAGFLLAGTALGLLQPGIAMAQEPVLLKEIVIDGGGTATGPVKGYVAKKTTVGSKSDMAITAIPQSVSVVGQQELQDRGVKKVDEALRYTAGITASPFGEDPDTDWIFIRGFQATQTGIFLDGLPLFGYGFGGFQLDPFMLERVEVLKGPASVLYGGANPGGIVNMVSKRPEKDRFGRIETGVNQYGNAYLGVDVGDKIDENGVWTYRFTGRIAGGEQQTDFAKDFRGSVMPQITYEPSADTKINVFGQFSALDQTHAGGAFLPYVGTVIDAPFGKISRKANFTEPGIDDGTNRQYMIGYEAEHTFDNGWKLSQNVRYGHQNKKETSPYPYGYVDPAYPYGGGPNPTTPDNQLYRIGFNHDTKVDTFLMDNRAEKEFTTGALEHNFLFGVDYKYFKIDQVQASGGATPISANNPVYGTPQGPTSVYLDQVLKMNQIGVYAQDQVRFGDGWLVTLNGRYDYVSIKSDSAEGPFFPLGPTYNYNKSAVSGRVGLGYEFSNGITPYVSAATFFNPVIGTTLEKPLKPEEGYQFEAGIKYAPDFVDGLLTASVFQITKQNALSRIPGTFIDTQLGEVTSTGLELEGKVNIDQNWKALASLTVLDMDITKDEDSALVGNWPTIVPKVSASFWLDYTVDQGPLEGVNLGAGVRYQGESYANKTNTLKVPDATLFDATIRYEKDTWGVALNVTNLFDKAYVKGCDGEAVCGYGDGRTITLSAHTKW
ncbi:TonB-dependent siderophore receptor [Phyllobacterium myrsinacearum]|uniref:Iron complex outermembrane receptor protein n=1 Tax=Phyllobacterium myrsinacearum TaxID=28101 RepID=A0A839EMC0_9HYPH|nr:TonB-dependent siderophore receptor [Phyllobacterium myrsinacearum]MBA8879992.1 iron complex outermembrane receptor protein [Phyllobacterium myrsinacearum]